MPSENGRQVTETQKALQAAQMLFEQGNNAAAEPIFNNILSQVAEDSAEAALCLSNLTEIYELRGDIRMALQCGLRLVHHPTQQSSQEVVCAHAERAADLLTALGETSEAEKLRQDIVRMQQGDPELMFGVPDQGEEAPAWLMHALKNAAYRCLERAGRQRTERSTRELTAPMSTGADLSRLDPTAALAEWHNTTSDMLNRLGSMFPAQEPAGDDVYQPKVGRERAAASVEPPPPPIPSTNQLNSPSSARIEPPDEFEEANSALSAESAKAGVMDAAYRMGAKISSAQKEVQEAVASKPSRPAVERNVAASSLRSSDSASSGPPMPGIVDLIYKLGSKFTFLKQSEPDYGRPQAIEEQAKPQQRASSTLALLALVVIGFIGAWHLLPRAGNPVYEYAHSDHQFKNAAQDKMVSFLSPSECELKYGQQTKRVRLNYYFGDWRDILTIMFAQPHSRSYFLRKEDNVLLDPEGTELFVADGPEIQLCERCQLMSQDVNSYFKDHKEYPPKTEAMEGVDWSYENPYTQAKEKEHPAITTLTFGSETTDQEVDDERADFYNKISGAKFWNVQHIMQPGQIRCFNAIFKSSRGNINVFVIGAADNKGNVLSGDSPQSAFCLISEDGKLKTGEPSILADNLVVWMAEHPIDLALQNFIERGGAMVLGCAALLALAGAFSSGRSRHKKAIWSLVTGILGAAAIFYFASKH